MKIRDTTRSATTTKQKGSPMKIEEVISIIDTHEITYGTVWSEEKLCEVFGISMPDLSSRNAREIVSAVHKFDIAKLNAYSTINKQLLNIGMCFVADGDNYRVPLISETQSFISKYYKASETKFKSAEKLRKSFSSLHPVEAKEVNDTMNRTISMRSSSEKHYQPMAK